MSVGDTLAIALKGNPTTGYRWELLSVNKAVLKAMGEPDYETSSNAMGAGGTFVFKFKAVAAGSSPVKLVYHRTFEVDTPPTKAFGVKVTVK